MQSSLLKAAEDLDFPKRSGKSKQPPGRGKGKGKDKGIRGQAVDLAKKQGISKGAIDEAMARAILRASMGLKSRLIAEQGPCPACLKKSFCGCFYGLYAGSQKEVGFISYCSRCV